MTLEKKQLPKRIFLLMAMRRPLAFFLIQRIIKKYLPGCTGNTGFTYGFECQFGNIKAHNVRLGNTIFNDHDLITIGEGTRFSEGNRIITGSHNIYDFNVCENKSVTIGKNCWITTGVIILPGIIIGDNCIIGSGSVVTKNIPQNSIAVGNPCKVISTINPDKIIYHLQ